MIAITASFRVADASPCCRAQICRLSEDPAVKVLLIEAGEDHDDNQLVSIPVACGDQQGSAELDWQYRAEPSKASSLGFVEGKSRWPRGKMLGGSSSMNYMMYCRGAKVRGRSVQPCRRSQSSHVFALVSTCVVIGSLPCAVAGRLRPVGRGWLHGLVVRGVFAVLQEDRGLR